MDPISVALLSALVGGVGGEAGREAWAKLRVLVGRPFRGRGDVDASAISTGEVELARLEQAPTDPAPAQALGVALAVRAALDTEFRDGLQQWHEQAKLVRTGDGEVHNTVSGGTQNGPMLQGRDFSGISFTMPPLPRATPGTAASPTQD